ncbi:MAG: hypothetical protein F7C36_01200 [Desulfurococcales archaeon]|nr:hypothetical protein [Desulfurococcales archaeon]
MSERKKRKRMTLPKKAEDIHQIVQEVEESHAHDHHHHHHHHAGDLDELLLVLELLIDSINANVNNLSSRVTQNSYEIARLYKILSYLVKAIATEDPAEKKQILEKAIDLLSATHPIPERS